MSFFEYYESQVDVGILLCQSNLAISKGQSVPTIYYKEGIPEVDNYLNGQNFFDLGLSFHFVSFKNSILFSFTNEDNTEKIGYGINREKISRIECYKDPQISVLDPNLFINALKNDGISGGGFVGTLITKAATKAIGSAVNKSRGVKTKNVIGLKYKLYYFDSNEEEKVIIIEVPQEYHLEALMILSYWKKDIPADAKPVSESGVCYLATVCYNDLNSKEIILFRKYRDEVLKKYFVGRKFIAFYYFIGPSLLQFLAHKEWLNHFIKNNILNKIYKNLSVKYK